MTDRKKIEIGVTDLVSFVFREGSIDNRGGGKARQQLGAKLHRIIQEEDQKRRQDYQKEVYFKFKHQYREYEFILTGRADAIYFQNNNPIIEEIKTTNKFKSNSFKPQEAHLAQLYFYGYFYMIENNLETIDLCLHYYHIVSEKHTYIKEHKSLKELTKYINNILESWLNIGYFKADWKFQRNQSIKNLDFIYNNFRPGQREICLAVYNTIKRKDKVLIEAPTGIGKTIGTLFPAIKQFPQSQFEQIYYLTAKNTIQKEANKALNKMRENGLKIKSTTITARDKICFLNQDQPDSRSCNPDDCPFAKDYYNKINSILSDYYKAYSNFDRDLIERIAKENNVCPYQLSLDFGQWSDVIICDYNYLFDPISSIEGFTRKRVCLVDEAHNLPDRSRNMYSAELNLYTFKRLRKALNTKKAKTIKENRKLLRQVKRLIRFLENFKEKIQKEDIENLELSSENLNKLGIQLFHFQNAAFIFFNKISSENIELDPEILEAFNECSNEVYRFNIINEYASKNDFYFNYIKTSEKNIIIRLVCLDTSKFISESLKNNSTIFFSATLTPFEYYKTVLLGKDIVPNIALPSPFDRNHYKVLCDNSISTRYSDREASYREIANIIKTFVLSKKGNYLIFFPSYNYLHTVYEIFDKLINEENLNVLIQNPNMNEEEREEFLNTFKTQSSTIGFCVMGGIFSEGVDLPLNSLIGTIIIGPGLPGIDFERDLIKNYYQKEIGQGFAYAYAYPGMNRVLQSAGRVIRTEEDRGIILFIDERFGNSFYYKMIPKHLKPDYLANSKELEEKLEEFWQSSHLKN